VALFERRFAPFAMRDNPLIAAQKPSPTIPDSMKTQS
jgi:hypothetical protein